MKTLLLFVGFAGLGLAQTQSGGLDFNGPVRLNRGASLPGTCVVGDVFFLTGATAGANIYQCAATNTWSAPGAVSTQTDLTDIKATNTTTVITIPAGHRPKNHHIPCSDGSASTQTITSGSATIYVSMAPDCTYQATSTVVFGASTGHFATASGSNFPVGHFPIATCVATSGSMAACTDARRAFSNAPDVAGTNIAFSYSAGGVRTISASGVGGSSVTKVPFTQYFPTVIESNSVATLAPGFLTPTVISTDPVPASISSKWGGIEFENADSGPLYFTTVVPVGWDGGAVTLVVHAVSSIATANNVALTLLTACFPTGFSHTAADPTWDATQLVILQSVGDGTTKRGEIFTFTPLPMSSCSVGKELQLAFLRTAGGAPDDFTGSIFLKSFEVTYRITLE